ncbi:MAG TPA: flagellar hook-length control protein FliK [Xanthobacteraceae bacterium]|nr:flagellar hook-length control protein FliK [Xanthobacteraceae bacterium]
MSSVVTSQLVPVAPSAPVAPAQLPQLQALGQMVGQILTGTVIALLNETTLRLQTPAGFLDVAAETPLPSGTPVAIAVQGTTQRPQIVITPVSAESQPPQPALQAGISHESSPAQIGASSAEESLPAQASGNSAAANLTTAAQSAAVAIVRNAAASQGSLGALYADLEAAVAAPTPSLPAPVLDVANSLLAMRLDVGSDAAIAAGDIKTVLMQSGLASAVPATADSTAANKAADIGSVLVALRQTLQTWLDQQPTPKTTITPPETVPPSTPQTSTRAVAPMPSYRVAPNVLQTLISQSSAPPPLPTTIAPREQAAHLLPQTYSDTMTAPPQENPTPPQSATRASVPMPPFRGAPGVPQAPVAPSLATTAPPREQAAHLLAQTDAAIARQTLLRIVSLPGGEQPSSSSPHNDDNSTRVMFEIPVATALGTGIVPMTVTRDGRKAETSGSLTSWIASFSIDLAAIGPVHVRIALVGERASVTFSAERPHSAELLGADLPLLGAGLRNAQIEPGELRCRVGDAAGSTGANRDGAARPQAAAPGMFLDQAS